MTKSEMLNKAVERKESETTNDIKESEVMNNVTKEVEEKEITKVLDISSDFINEFYENASEVDKEWIAEQMEIAVTAAEAKTAGKGEVRYFASFRSAFATKYFPELFSTKKGQKKETLLDRIRKDRQVKGGVA